MDDNNLLNSNQPGFHPGDLCTPAVISNKRYL